MYEGPILRLGDSILATKFGDKMSLSAVSAWNKKYIDIL